MKVAVIGGGAAGFFAAISIKEHHPKSNVVLFEKSPKVLSKVKVSGGGRCNVTHSCFEISELIKHYPRGAKFLKKAFHQFKVIDTIDWFDTFNVQLKTESDNRMFPTTDNSQTIIDCLTNQFDQLGCVLKLQSAVTKITSLNSNKGFELIVNDKKMSFDKIIVATGGSPKIEGLKWLQNLGHKIEKPVPSLFTFNMPKHPITALMGAVAPNVKVRIEGEKLESTGPLLITHWGMSGPAVLKLSSFGARKLAEKNYQFNIFVSWLGQLSEDVVRALFQKEISKHSLSQISNYKLPGIPKRLWVYLVEKVGIELDKRWCDFSKKDLNRLVNGLVNDSYQVQGKTTFKEEFVTCGGVSLVDVNPNSMESKKIPGIYFSGELLNIDGVTGGFNFQAAWTTGFIAGKLS